jgi:hypothetical protein
VRLRSTADDTVAIGVELARFHDGAALALAAALHLAVPRRRGRPSRTRRSETPSDAGLVATTGNQSANLGRALATLRLESSDEGTSAIALLSVFLEGEIPFVIAGPVAKAAHLGAGESQSLDLVADLTTRHARTLAAALNRLRAKPRGVRARDSFTFDSTLIRSAPCLALRVGSIALNVSRTLAGVGEFPQVLESSVRVELEGAAYRVLSAEGVARASNALPRSVGAA